MNAHASFIRQVLLMGATSMTVAAISDSLYAVMASSARAALTRRRARLMSRAAAAC